MSTGTVSFTVTASGPDLLLTVTMDGIEIYQGYPLEPQRIIHEFDDSTESNHVLSLQLSGKLADHTQLDANGNIVHDRTITVDDFCIDDIPLGHILTDVTEYRHDHNGTTDPVTDKFYSVMGCNGRVEMQFSTPIYLWLLEKM